MSEVSNFGVLRFKFKEEFDSMDDFYKVLRGILGEPDSLVYASNWDGEGFVETDEIEYFSYEEKAGGYSVRVDDDGNKYLDYHLIDSDENCQDLYVSLDLTELTDIKSKTLDKFSNLLYDDCKLKIFEWYTGCDMPVNF